mgnify:CR=1 FL=1
MANVRDSVRHKKIARPYSFLQVFCVSKILERVAGILGRMQGQVIWIVIEVLLLIFQQFLKEALYIL